MGEAFLVRKGGGVDASDSTATAADIISGKKAYITDSDEPAIGTLPLVNPISTDQFQAVGDPVFGASSSDKPTQQYLYARLQDNSEKRAYNGVQWVRTEAAKVASVIGATPEKIVKGSDICGVAGTASPMTSILGNKESYYAYAGQNIRAGNFVKFLTGVAGIGAGSAQWRSIIAGRILIDTCTISSTQILVLNCVSSGNDYAFYATLVGVDGVEFYVQADVSVGTISSSYYRNCKLFNYENGYVSILVAAGDTSLYSGLVLISGSTINVIANAISHYFSLTTISSSIRIGAYDVDQSQKGSINPFGKTIAGTNYLTVIAYGYDTAASRMIMLFTVNFSNGALSYISGLWSFASSTNARSRSFAYSNNGRVLLGSAFESGKSYPAQAYKFDISPSGVVTSATAYNMSWSYNTNTIDCCYYSDTQGLVVGDVTYGSLGIMISAFTQNGSAFTSGASVALESSGTSHVAFTVRLDTNVVLLAYVVDAAVIKFRTIVLNGDTVTIGASKDVAGSNNNWLKWALRMMHMLYGGKLYIVEGSITGNSTNSLMIINAPSNGVIDTVNYLYETQIAVSNNRWEINGVSLGDAVGGISTGAGAGHNQATQIITV